MAFELTARALLLSQKTIIEQQIVLKIDGIDTIYGAVHIIKRLLYGDEGAVFGVGGLLYGGGIRDVNSRDFISLKGSTKTISQQLNQDKGGSGSVSSINIELVDKDQFVSNQFTSIEVLGRKADVYLMFQNSIFPTDAIKIMSGNISSRDLGSGSVKIKIDHPENLKRQNLFTLVDTELVSAINSSQTTIPLKSAVGLISPSSGLRTFVRVEDEIIEYSSISGNNLTGASRGSLLTIPRAHDIEESTKSFYQISDTPLILALKLMLSGRGMDGSEPIVSFNVISSTLNVPNAVFFSDNNIRQTLGLTVGDTITVTNSALNNSQNRVIESFHLTDEGSYFILEAPFDLQDEIATDTNKPTLSWKSRYDIFGVGGALLPSEVDVERHEDLQNLLGSSFPDYEPYIKETTALNDLIDNIYFSVGCYQVPRLGRASVGATLPPLAVAKTKTIGKNEILNAENLVITRTTSESFFNAIVYRYNEDVLTDRFLSGSVVLSEESQAQIRVGLKPLTLESKGFRRGQATTNFINAQTKRFTDRYAFAAESITVDVNYKTGFNLDVSDTIILNGEGLQIADSTNGTRDFQPRVMEIVNKSLSITTGKIKLKLLDTGFGIDVRYGTISPSSFSNGGTNTFLKINSTAELAKWAQYIGAPISIHDENYTYQIQTVIKSITVEGLIVEPMGVSDTNGDVIDIANYNESNEFLKRIHCFLGKSDQVVSGISQTQFTVANNSFYFIGGFVSLHNESFSIETKSVKILNIVGNTITVESMGVTPNNSYSISYIGFASDNGSSYAYL